jgi:hypothetical protein
VYTRSRPRRRSDPIDRIAGGRTWRTRTWRHYQRKHMCSHTFAKAHRDLRALKYPRARMSRLISASPAEKPPLLLLPRRMASRLRTPLLEHLLSSPRVPSWKTQVILIHRRKLIPARLLDGEVANTTQLQGEPCLYRHYFHTYHTKEFNAEQSRNASSQHTERSREDRRNSQDRDCSR